MYSIIKNSIHYSQLKAILSDLIKLLLIYIGIHIIQNQMSKKSINKKKIIIYTTKTCGYCYLAKKLLKKYSLKYKEIDVSNNNIVINEMIRKSSGIKTVPQIFFNNKHIGGFYELNQLHLNGNLTKSL